MNGHALPPGVHGPEHARLTCRITRVRLEYPELSVMCRLLWWGSISEGATVVPANFASPTSISSVTFPIQTDLESFAAYLQDARVLNISVSSDSGVLIGTSSVSLQSFRLKDLKSGIGFDVSSQIKDYGKEVGTLDISFSIAVREESVGESLDERAENRASDVFSSKLSDISELLNRSSRTLKCLNESRITSGAIAESCDSLGWVSGRFVPRASTDRNRSIPFMSAPEAAASTNTATVPKHEQCVSVKGSITLHSVDLVSQVPWSSICVRALGVSVPMTLDVIGSSVRFSSLHVPGQLSVEVWASDPRRLIGVGRRDLLSVGKSVVFCYNAIDMSIAGSVTIALSNDDVLTSDQEHFSVPGQERNDAQPRFASKDEPEELRASRVHSAQGIPKSSMVSKIFRGSPERVIKVDIGAAEPCSLTQTTKASDEFDAEVHDLENPGIDAPHDLSAIPERRSPVELSDLAETYIVRHSRVELKDLLQLPPRVAPIDTSGEAVSKPELEVVNSPGVCLSDELLNGSFLSDESSDIMSLSKAFPLSPKPAVSKAAPHANRQLEDSREFFRRSANSLAIDAHTGLFRVSLSIPEFDLQDSRASIGGRFGFGSEEKPDRRISREFESSRDIRASRDFSSASRTNARESDSMREIAAKLQENEFRLARLRDSQDLRVAHMSAMRTLDDSIRILSGQGIAAEPSVSAQIVSQQFMTGSSLELIPDEGVDFRRADILDSPTDRRAEDLHEALKDPTSVSPKGSGGVREEADSAHNLKRKKKRRSSRRPNVVLETSSLLCKPAEQEPETQKYSNLPLAPSALVPPATAEVAARTDLRNVSNMDSTHTPAPPSLRKPVFRYAAGSISALKAQLTPDAARIAEIISSSHFQQGDAVSGSRRAQRY